MAPLEVVPEGTVLTTPPRSGSLQTERNTMNLTSAALAYLAAGFGAGLAIIGAGNGIGKLASSAMDGIARQPSAAGDIRGGMIVAAGLIEGATFFALVICILLALKA